MQKLEVLCIQLLLWSQTRAIIEREPGDTHVNVASIGDVDTYVNVASIGENTDTMKNINRLQTSRI